MTLLSFGGVKDTSGVLLGGKSVREEVVELLVSSDGEKQSRWW
jgi:hypothetical protein